MTQRDNTNTRVAKSYNSLPVPALLLIWCVLLSGCGMLDWSRRGIDDDEVTRKLASIDDTRGPLERLLMRRKKERGDESGQLSSAAGTEEFAKAKELFDDDQFKAAEKVANKVAKKYKNSPVSEDALFLIAESQFQRKRYSWAQDSYDRLLKEFPSTGYLDDVSKRMFRIAHYWLQDPEYVTADDIQPVNFEEPSATAPPKSRRSKGWDISRRIPIFPNFWNRSRPVFDTEGRALEALKSIWEKNPTGNLADDALMLEASYHLRSGNYIEADHIFGILRSEYSKSRHFENAFVLGSHAKLMSYQGAEYETKSLDKARQLKESALRQFPKRLDRERQLEEVRRIDDEKAAAEWETVRYYQTKGKPKAVAIYCREITKNFPDSPYSIRARQALAKLDPKYNRVPGRKQPPYEEAEDADNTSPEQQRDDDRLRSPKPFAPSGSVSPARIEDGPHTDSEGQSESEPSGHTHL